jgi:TRAP-type C4-dicarboxylate transport system permease small subunit
VIAVTVRVLSLARRACHGASGILGVLASTLTMAIMAAIVVDVTVRVSSGASVPGLYELVELSVAAAVFLGLPATQRDDAMIQVKLLTERLAPRPRRAVKIVAEGFSLAVCLALAAAAFHSFFAALAVHEARIGLIIAPTWPSRLAIALGLVVLSGELLISLAKTATAGRRAGAADRQEPEA